MLVYNNLRVPFDINFLVAKLIFDGGSHKHTHTQMHTHTYIYKYIFIHTYIYIYAHTQTIFSLECLLGKTFNLQHFVVKT